MPGTDFSKYHTYAWVTSGDLGSPDQILDAEIKQSVDSQLVGKGFTKVDSGTPDSAAAAGLPPAPGLPRPSGFPQPPSLPQPLDPNSMARTTNSAHSAEGDLLIAYQIGIQQERQWNAFGTRDALGGGFDTASGTATSSTVNNGILMLSIYDARGKQLIWRGFAVKEINLSKDQQKNRKNLDRVTQKLLKDFPPRGK
ncbi:MAG: DUF4136 domain-containing protein [Acidobacteriaceae bacterium]|nr:DUF4136 domain-containing protein [Acidobacteriaceae bacterium]